MGMECLDDFFIGIQLCAEGRATAGFMRQSSPEAFRLPLNEALFDHKRYETGLKEVKSVLGADEDGMKLFVYLSRCAMQTYRHYEEKGIEEAVYWDTMKFLSRFIADDLRKSGKLVFRWGWWFPRQLSMREFRLGALEYEMSEDANGKKIFLHIPSDADLSERSVSHSIGAAKSFFEKYYPDFAGADMYCDSWMLAPALREVLPESSNIMNFRRRFEVIRVNEDSKAFLEWIYPDPSVSHSMLPETTSLQRNVKSRLLSGGKIGWALGRMKK